MQDAENQVDESTEENQSADSQEQEIQIPKHRFDAAAQQVRLLKEELEMKNRALQELNSRFQPPAVQQDDEETELENLGLPKEAVRAIKRMTEKKVAQAKQEVGMHLSTLAMKTDEAKFLQKHGMDKEVYLDKIGEMRRAHAARGSFLDIETAYKLIAFDEIQRKPAPKKSKEAEAKVVEKASEVKKTVVAQPQGKSIEELEDELDELVKGGNLRL